MLLLVALMGGLGRRGGLVSEGAPGALSPRQVDVPEAGHGLAASVAAGVVLPPPQGDAAEAEDDAVMVCGVGRVTRQQAESWNPIARTDLALKMRALDQRGEAAMSRLSARLAVGADREQVAARMLMGDREGAAAIATRSQDAAAYRLALLGCAGEKDSPSAPSCRGLTAQAWARLDPGDAAPWLQLMGEAMQRRDEAAATEALEQVLQRRRRSPSRPLVLAADAGRAGVDDEVGLGLAVVRVVGMDAALPDAGPMALGRYCAVTAVKEEARRARCERLARWQFAHADSVMDGMLADSIADRVGLPADQRPFTREQLKRGLEALTEQSLRFSGFDCASLAQVAQWPALFSRQGELQMALQAVVQR